MKPDKKMSMIFRGRKILVTGGTGSIGSEIVRQLLPFSPSQLRVLSRDEYKQYRMAHALGHPAAVRFLLGDVRDGDRVQKAMEDVDVVFHAAALKHVPACEFNPFEAVQTNVSGSQNVINKAIYAGANRVVVISTDKAAAPLSVMGATKLLSEKIATSAVYHQGRRATICAAVRFGNVLASRGSVLELFEDQLARGRPITVTDPRMTRFVMTVAEAVSLVLTASVLMHGSEVFILKMPSLRLIDLAQSFIDVCAPRLGRDRKQVKVVVTGRRPGEKQDELLMTREESRLALERRDMFVLRPFVQFQELGFVPVHRYGRVRTARLADYSSSSQKLASREQIRKMIQGALAAPAA